MYAEASICTSAVGSIRVAFCFHGSTVAYARILHSPTSPYLAVWMDKKGALERGEENKERAGSTLMSSFPNKVKHLFRYFDRY